MSNNKNSTRVNRGEVRDIQRLAERSAYKLVPYAINVVRKELGDEIELLLKKQKEKPIQLTIRLPESYVDYVDSELERRIDCPSRSALVAEMLIEYVDSILATRSEDEEDIGSIRVVRPEDIWE